MRDSDSPSPKPQRQNAGSVKRAPKIGQGKTKPRTAASKTTAKNTAAKNTAPEMAGLPRRPAGANGSGRQQKPQAKRRLGGSGQGSGAHGSTQGGGKQSSAKQGSGTRVCGPNYRQRRLIALAVVLGLLVALVGGGVLAVKEAQKWYAKQQAQAQELRLALAERTYDPPGPCGAQDLFYSLENANPVAYPGQGISSKVTLRNQGKKPCLVQVSGKSLGVQVVSGNEIIYNSTTCGGEETKQLLLATGDTWANEYKWDGRGASGQCGVPGQPALPGTYRVVIWKDGQPASTESVFAVQNPPAPAPAPSEANAPAQNQPQTAPQQSTAPQNPAH